MIKINKMLGSLFLIGIIMIIIDYFYLSLISDIFKDYIFIIQKSVLRIRYMPAFLCYLLLITGLYYFVINKEKKMLDAFILGLCIYGVFETTNYAILRDWPITMVFVDSIWGGLLMVLTTLIYKNLKLNFNLNLI